MKNLSNDRFCFFVVTVQRDENGLFIPYVVEALGIISLWFQKNLEVGDVDNPPGALIGIHPVADFQKGKLKKPQIDNIPFDRSEEHTSELQSRENLVCR